MACLSACGPLSLFLGSSERLCTACVFVCVCVCVCACTCRHVHIRVPYPHGGLPPEALHTLTLLPTHVTSLTVTSETGPDEYGHELVDPRTLLRSYTVGRVKWPTLLEVLPEHVCYVRRELVSRDTYTYTHTYTVPAVLH